MDNEIEAVGGPLRHPERVLMEEEAVAAAVSGALVVVVVLLPWVGTLQTRTIPVPTPRPLLRTVSWQ